ncbi:MAG: DUF4252 domain-containing protein [Hyphomicrobiales bacterium]
MKTLLRSLIFALILVPTLLIGQDKNPIDKLYEKYGSEDGVTAVNFSSEILKLMAQTQLDSLTMASEGVDINSDILDNLKGITILSVPETSSTSKEFAEDIRSTYGKGYIDLMTVKEPDASFRIAYAGNGKGKINDLVVIALEKGETTLISIVGSIDLKTVMKIANKYDLKQFAKSRNKNKNK